MKRVNFKRRDKRSLPLNKEINIALMSLNSQKPFASFDIKFSSAEKDTLDKIDIDHENAYDNFGHLDVLANEVETFIKSIGKNNTKKSKSVADLVTRLVNNAILSFKKETAWVAVRAFTATNFWDSPRWHSDGYYYSPYTGEQYKIAIALKGASTLFYPLADEMREKFNSLQFNPENRETISKMLDTSKAVSVALGHGAIFIVGTPYAAVHSEPPIHEERLFLSIVPGNKAEIEELYNNWHPKK